MTMWTVIANPWLTINGADKMFLFVSLCFLFAIMEMVRLASLSNNKYDDSENVTKKNYSVSIWNRAICQMQASFPGDEFLSTGLKR